MLIDMTEDIFLSRKKKHSSPIIINADLRNQTHVPCLSCVLSHCSTGLISPKYC